MTAMTLSDEPAAEVRHYNSPLRQAQAERTRDTILDALTELLADRPSDEISTKDLAAVAGVAERTVYRHFPDRSALHHGLADRAVEAGGPDIDQMGTLDEIVDVLPEIFAGFDENAAVIRAAVLLSSDPRRLATDTRDRSVEWAALTARTFPELDEGQHHGLAAVTRLFGSSQTWLRLREQFDLNGDQSGALMAWAMEALLREVRAGNSPPAD